MHDDDTLEDAEELSREIRERRLHGGAPAVGEDSASDGLPGPSAPADDETIAVGSQSVGEAGTGWLLSDDDDETIDVDPEILRELRSAPAVREDSAGDETVVADVSRLAVTRVPESVPGPPEARLDAPGPAPGRGVPPWRWMAAGLLVVAVLAAVAFLAGRLTSGADDTDDLTPPPAPARQGEGRQTESPRVEEPTASEPVSEPETTIADDGEADEAPVAGEPALPGEGVDVIAGRANWSTGYFQAEVYKQLLEELGYNVSDPADLELDPDIGYVAMAEGDMDYWPNSWYPGHLAWLAGELPDGSLVGNHVTIVGEEMIAGGLQGFLINKSFSDEYGVYTLDDLNNNPEALAAFDATDPVPGNGIADIFGCPEWHRCDNLIANIIAFNGWDNINQIIIGYDAMFAEAVAKVEAGEPMVVYTWTPSTYITQLRPGDNVYWAGVGEILDDSNPANQEGGEEHDQRGADGSGGYVAIGPDQCPAAADNPDGLCPIGWIAADILVTANNDFLAANPAAEALFEAVKLSVIDVSLANVDQDGSADPSDLATQWIADNRNQVDAWIAAALSAA